MFAAGFALIPIDQSLEPGDIGVPTAYAICAAFFGLPMVGFGFIVNRPVLCGSMGMAVGLLIFYCRSLLT
jgi:hypothetical protein